jgi:drug/metabolite transporter (DMT)-like permease
LILLGVLAVLWASTYTFIKIGVETIPPMTLIAARSLLAGLLLWGIMAARGLAMPRDGAMWRRFLLQSCLNVVFPFSLIAWAELTVDAALATILNSTSPIFTFLITVMITRHEVVTARKLVGVVIGIAGILLIVGLEALSGAGRNLAAQLALVVATIAFALAAVTGRNLRSLDPMVPAAGSLLGGGLLLLPVSLLTEQPWAIEPSGRSLAALAGLAVFTSALGVVIYFRLLGTLGSVGTTAQAYLRVPIGVAMGVVFLDETLAPTAWAGLVFVFIGVAAMTIPKRRPLQGGSAGPRSPQQCEPVARDGDTGRGSRD